ncbi:MAG: mandelate racemase/muconate lactonizing enzyme family protein [Candidatus Marinimicrobia bacterium]|nr:mandelate racemase/muconate lactonizing enzyme family protein [Candidatus Neomarinimicrobiota bacterium]
MEKKGSSLMNISRRQFIGAAVGTGVLQLLPSGLQSQTNADTLSEQINKARHTPVLNRELFAEPVIIESMDLILNNREYIVRVRSKDGAEGFGVGNRSRLEFSYPIFLKQVAPYFLGKDARDLDELIHGVYLHDSNYKLQGLPFWISVAPAEFAILDMLGHISDKPIGELLGTVVRKDIGVYRATNNRGRSPEDTVERMQALVDETDTRAVKFKLGARMYYTDETMERDKNLIPLVRKHFGDDMTIYSDANGSFDVPGAVEIGRILEDYQIDFFEEPCPFDHYDWSKEISDALSVDIAGGECESSLHQFKWLIQNNAHQFVQPDLHYFGGYIRATRVARMAEVMGIPIVPHMSGVGHGYLQVLHFASYIPNSGPYQEYKGKTENFDFECPTSDLTVRDSKIRVPAGPGFGVTIDPEFIRNGTILTA